VWHGAFVVEDGERDWISEQMVPSHAGIEVSAILCADLSQHPMKGFRRRLAELILRDHRGVMGSPDPEHLAHN